MFQTLSDLDWKALEFGEVIDSNTSHVVKYKHNQNIANVAQSTQELSKLVESAIASESVPVILGGDHSLSIGSVHGTLKSFNSNIGLIWIDAHADINTPLTSGSGNLHGQPVSFLVDELIDYMPKLNGFEWIQSRISVKNIVYIGLRDVDPGEQ